MPIRRVGLAGADVAFPGALAHRLNLSGPGASGAASRSDHDHDEDYAGLVHAHDLDYADIAHTHDLGAPTLEEGTYGSTTAISTTITTFVTKIITTTRVNTVVHVHTFWDWEVTTVGTGFVNGYVGVDGSAGTLVCAMSDFAVRREPFNAGRILTTTLASIGAHTFTMRCNKNAAGGVVNLSVNTRIQLKVYY